MGLNWVEWIKLLGAICAIAGVLLAAYAFIFRWRMLLTLETPAAQKKILDAIGSDEGKKKVGELLQLATGTIASSLAGDDARKQVITMLAHPDTRAAVANLLTERVLLDALAGAITDSAVQAQLLTFLGGGDAHKKIAAAIDSDDGRPAVASALSDAAAKGAIAAVINEKEGRTKVAEALNSNDAREAVAAMIANRVIRDQLLLFFDDIEAQRKIASVIDGRGLLDTDSALALLDTRPAIDKLVALMHREDVGEVLLNAVLFRLSMSERTRIDHVVAMLSPALDARETLLKEMMAALNRALEIAGDRK